MVLLIDNYDSFSYNLFQQICQLGYRVEVFKNDKISLSQVQVMNPQAIVLSPGPSRPEQAGICLELVKQLAGQKPILGVCLGHQVIAQAFGFEVCEASQVLHGKVTPILQEEGDHFLFEGLPRAFEATRYNSLIVKRKENSAPQMKTIARSPEGEIMALAHLAFPLVGCQFHPESYKTQFGMRVIKNFMKHSFLKCQKNFSKEKII